MGKKSSTATEASKKAKKTVAGRDPSVLPIGSWDRTKFTAKDLQADQGGLR
jgi:hypothetical protein